MKHTDDIQRMVEAYYEGTASEAEEADLKQLLASDDCPPELETEKRLLAALDELSSDVPPVPSGLEKRIAAAIDARAAAPTHPRRHRPRLWLWASSIAASLLLVAGIARLADFDSFSQQPKDTFSDPQEAYLVLRSTLMEISTKLNEGMAQAASFEQDLRQTNQEIHQLITAKN